MILYAPDSYGGFLGAPEACRLAGALWPGLALHPLADGGEGALDALGWHEALEQREILVCGPLGEKVRARWGIGAGGAFAEAALAGGLALVSERRPLQATSYGVGQLAAAALAGGPATLGLGGSATVDGGLGALQALGLRILDARGAPLPSPGVAADLARAAGIEGDPPEVGGLTALCDVRTVLGACAERFGPQKGLNFNEISPLTADLERWAGLLNAWRERRGWETLPLDLAGGGAAGGLGFALAAIGARLEPGADAFARRTGLERAIAGKRAVILGEGRLDATSYEGKVASAVTAAARAAGATVAALVGTARDVPPPPVGPDVVVEIGGESREAFAAAVWRLRAQL